MSGDEQREGADLVAGDVPGAGPERESHCAPQSLVSERPQRERGEQDTEFAPAAVMLLVQPYLTLRLVAQLRPVARRLRIAALLGFLVTALPFLPTPA